MPPCVDAKVLVTPAAMTALLQLPASWVATGMHQRDDGIFEVGVVFPDGPSDLPPIELIPTYKRVSSSEGPVIALDQITVRSAVPQRPVRA